MARIELYKVQLYIYPPSVYVESLRKSTETKAFHERRHSKANNTTYAVWVTESKIKCWLDTKILCNKEDLTCVEEEGVRTQITEYSMINKINMTIITSLSSHLSIYPVGLTLHLRHQIMFI